MKYIVSLRGKQYEVEVEHGEARMLRVSDVQPSPPILPDAPPAAPAPATPAANGEAVPVPMSGVIVSIRCSAGQSVKQGDLLAVLEAMKMENELFAPFDGTVTKLAVEPGASVNTGDPLLFLQRKEG